MNKIVTEKMTDYTVKAYVEGDPNAFEMGDNETVAVCKLLLKLQGNSSRTWSGSFMLSLYSWTSVFVISWLMLTERIDAGIVEWFFWIFFLFLGVVASAFASRK